MKIAKLILVVLMIVLPAVTVLPQAPPQRDVPAEVDTARRALYSAKVELEHAGSDWGGHKYEAIKHIDAALKELGEAETWAREHHQTK
jgi:hypothetical protein